MNIQGVVVPDPPAVQALAVNSRASSPPFGEQARLKSGMEAAGEMGLGAAKVWPKAAGPEDGVCLLAAVRRIARSG